MQAFQNLREQSMVCVQFCFDAAFLREYFNVVIFSNGLLIISVCYDFVLHSGDEDHRADIDLIRVR